ncbi:MAG: hypothetical protein IT289_03975 [Oligoflexia bacterium]|nr:hypothetical protein [Oligoflexia bacterium]
MKNLIVVSVIIFGSSLSRADRIVNASLDLQCKARGLKVRIISGSEGSVVLVNDKKVHAGEQLRAGTEGGPPYLQIYGGAFSVDMSGGDFEKSFNERVAVEGGEVEITVTDVSTGKRYEANCKGLIDVSGN